MPHISYHILYYLILYYHNIYCNIFLPALLVAVDEMPRSVPFTFNWRNGSYRITMRSPGLTFTGFNSKYNIGSHFSETTVGEKRQHIFWLNIRRRMLQRNVYYEPKNVQNKGLSDATSLTNARNYIQIETWEWTRKVTKRGISCWCRCGHRYSIILSFLMSPESRCKIGFAFKTSLCEKLKYSIKSGQCEGRYVPVLWLPLDIAWFYEQNNYLYQRHKSLLPLKRGRKEGYKSIKNCVVGHTDAGAWEGWRVSKLPGAAVTYITISKQLATENVTLSIRALEQKYFI
jgi:hypothetical protein